MGGVGGGIGDRRMLVRVPRHRHAQIRIRAVAPRLAQCDATLPDARAFAIVGVNGGVSQSASAPGGSPSSEAAWPRHASSPDCSAAMISSQVRVSSGSTSMPQVQHYGEAGKTFERFVRFMRDMPVNFVIVSHEILTDGPDGPLLTPGGFGNALPPKVCGWVDYVGYVGVVPPAEGEDGGDRHVAQFIPGNNRYAKNSEGALPKVADLNITEWLSLIAKAGKAGA